MDAQWANDRGLATVIDLEARRALRLVSPVSVRVRRSGSWRILEFEGELDIQALPLVAELVGSGTALVVFELHGVTFIDARGLGMLIETRRKALEVGGCVRLVAPSSSVQKLLTLTGGDLIFPMFDSVLEAVRTPIDAEPPPA